MGENTNYFHADNGDFARGLPTKPGYYWFKIRGTVCVCKVLLGGAFGGGQWHEAVAVYGGWLRREGDAPPPRVPPTPEYQNYFSLDDPFILDAEYAPMSPPGGW